MFEWPRLGNHAEWGRIPREKNVFLVRSIVRSVKVRYFINFRRYNRLRRKKIDLYYGLIYLKS